MNGEWLNHLDQKSRDDRPARSSGLREEKKKVIVLYKEEGETPLECINRAKEEGVISKGEKATYAGRLDPMAEGLLIVLFGESVHKKEEYLKLSKEYEVEVLLGVSSDTGDVLGLVEKNKLNPEISEEKIKEVLKNCIGEFEEEYPKFSSKTVHGKPLFSLARLGHIFKSPKHKVIIHSIFLQNIRIIKVMEVATQSIDRIKKVKGDFRQEEIIAGWNDLKKIAGEKNILVISIKVYCESGAYMRVLAEKIGKSLGYPALALRIKRIKIGEFVL